MNFKDFNIKSKLPSFKGDKIKIDRVLNTEITVTGYKITNSTKKPGTKLLTLEIVKGDTYHIIFTGSANLMDLIEQVPKEGFPFNTTIIKDSERLEFT